MKPEDQAFPSFGVIHWNKEKQQFEAFNPMPGMSKRLYIATQLLQGVVSASHGPDIPMYDFAKGSLMLADALIEEDRKTKP